MAENLRTARRFNGWTQEQLAERAGVSQTTIDKIEQGKTLKSRFLPNIALALDVPLEMLDPSIARAKEEWNTRIKESPGRFYVRRTLEELPIFETISEAEAGVFRLRLDTTDKVASPRWMDGADVICISCSSDAMSPEIEKGDAAFFDIDGTLYAGKTGLFMTSRPNNGINDERIKFIVAKLVRSDEENWHVQLIKRKIDIKLPIEAWPLSAPLRVRYAIDPGSKITIK